MNRFTTLRFCAPALAAVLLMGCSSASMSTPSPAGGGATAEEAQVPGAIHWVRTAAEHRAIYEQVYAVAADRVALAAADLMEPWGVILDADETVLDNSTYQLRRARAGLGFTPDTWNAWVREESATALPGAVAFIRGVRALGGRVAIVTNRDDAVCDPTRRNLRAVGVEADVVLCKKPGPSEKETRFLAVQDGSADAGLPPLHVVAWVGDNIHDFPSGSQAVRTGPSAALADFGTRFFIVPNPMYGSWESNPPR